jgi:transcriptional regulator with XRE-family HTH domain
MTNIQRLFIANLRFYRTQRNLSQLALSEKIGISPNYLNAVENGKNFPSPEVLERMTQVLHILPYQMFLESPALTSENWNGEKERLLDLKQKLCAVIDEELGT